MLVVGSDRLTEFCRKHADARSRLARWLAVGEGATWRTFAQVRATFPSADLARKEDVNFVVFNVGGNDYRIVAIVQYQAGVVAIEGVTTHEEYTRWCRS